MVGSNSSVHGGRHGKEEPPVSRTELHEFENSLLHAMERMFNEHLPTVRGSSFGFPNKELWPD